VVESAKRARKARGLSLSQVAASSGVHRMAIARAERQGTDVRATTLAALAKALGAPVCELFAETGHERQRRRRRRSGRCRQRGVFERPRGSGVWWVRYHDEHKREHREKVGPKALALKVYQKRKNEVQEHRFFPERIRRCDVLLADMIDDYLARAESLRAFAEYERAARYWKEALPGRTLADVMPGDIERYMVQRSQEVAPATVNRALSFLRRVFNVAISDGKADRNPVRAVKFFKENTQRVRFLTEEEEGRLRDAVGGEHWPLVAVALHTGLRRAEQFTLRWEHVDFTTGILTVPRSKHGEARRVPMNDMVRDILRARPSRLKSPYVFPSTTGATPLDAKNFMSRVFVPALRRAGIENFHWHDLRHTFANRLVMAGVDLRTVQELMGHKGIAMTLRYAHLSPAHQLDAVQRLARPRTGTTTGADPAAAPRATEAIAQGSKKPAELRAGDRGRTGDVQLGKLKRGKRRNPWRS